MPKKYTKEFKVEVCKLIIEENMKQTVVAQKLALNVNLVYRWLKEYKLHGDEAFTGQGKMRASDIKIKKLTNENNRLKKEIIRLKDIISKTKT